MTESDMTPNIIKKFVKRITYAPYICKIPRRGIQEITCYPDAIVLHFNGKRIGYSEREKTMIVLPGVRGKDGICSAQTAVANYLLQKKKREQKIKGS